MHYPLDDRASAYGYPRAGTGTHINRCAALVPI